MKKRDIDIKIKKYEPMMHWLLKRYNIKLDYEDILQELRISTWKILIKNPRPNSKAGYIENNKTKFSTYLLEALKNRLIDVLKVDYRVDLNKYEDKKDPNQDELEKLQKSKKLNKLNHNVVNPELIEDLSFEQKINALKDGYSADSIRFKIDMDIFENALNEVDKKIWRLNLDGWTQKEISKELKKGNVSKDRTTISKRLSKINKKFKEFIIKGEL